MKKIFLFGTLLLCFGCMQEKEHKNNIMRYSYSETDYKSISLEENGIRLGKTNDEKYVLIDEENNTINKLNRDYEDIKFYKDDFLVKSNKKYGLIDKTQKELIPIKYDLIRKIDSDIYAVSNGEKQALVNLKRNLTDFDYDNLGDLSDGVILGLRDNQIIGIDEKGKEILKVEYSYVSNFSEGYAIVLLDTGKQNYINKAGNKILNVEYDHLFPILDGKGIVIKDKKYGLIDIKSKEEIIKPQYDYLERIDNNRYIGRKGEKVILLDSNNKKIMETEFEYLENTSNNLLVGRVNGKYGYLDKNGKIIIPFIYEEIGDYINDTVIVCEDGYYGIINKDNEYITKKKYFYISDRNKNLFVAGNEKGKEVLIDIKGREILKEEYDNLYILNDNFVIGNKGEKKELIIILKDGIQKLNFTSIDVENVDDNEVMYKRDGKYEVIKVK